jgi:ATP-dependent DNA ligase
VSFALPYPFPLMEARSATKLPQGPEWLYEPKWDGFRCLAFRDGDEVRLQSKAAKPLERYFPDVVATVKSLTATRAVMDGEMVVPIDGMFSFDDLLQRIHPAESRVKKLAAEHPAEYILFDLLVDAKGSRITELPLDERRAKLGQFFQKHAKSPGLRLSPFTADRAEAAGWLQSAGRNLDGVVAKRRDLPYQSGERTGMVKVKRIRTADCVVGGFRYASSGGGVGSLLLGLYDKPGGLLHHVGFTSALSATDKKVLTPQLEALIKPPGFTGRAPGGPSRWSTERTGEWQPLETSLVVEVSYDHFSGGRFRHGTKLLRWRPDKAPKQCLMEQVGR